MQNNWENLEIDDLHSASVIETETASAASEVQTVNFPDYQCSIRMIRVHDLMYDPRLRLQILPGGLVPTEGIDEWSLNFFRGGYPKDSFREPFKPRYSDQEVCVLSNTISRNFGHWTTEQLLKVIILEKIGFTGTYVLNGQPDFCHVFLDCLGIPEDRILDVEAEPTVFKTAVLTMPITAEEYPKCPGLFFLLRDSLLNIGNRGLAATPRRIWFDRVMSVRNRRDFVNRDEVYDLITRYGFQVVDMAAHHVCDQIAIASGAEAVMGMHSAAFTNAMFMNPRSTVIECFSPEFINTGGVWEICSLLRHRYAMVVHNNAYGAYEWGQALKVNCFQLELVLQSFDL